jgi:hypothetical protein
VTLLERARELAKAPNPPWPIGPKPLLTIITLPGLPAAVLEKRDPTSRGR